MISSDAVEHIINTKIIGTINKPTGNFSGSVSKKKLIAATILRAKRVIIFLGFIANKVKLFRQKKKSGASTKPDFFFVVDLGA